MRKNRHLILIFLFLAIFCSVSTAQWTEPVLISGDRSLLSPRSVIVGDTIHVVGSGGVDFYYLRSNDNGGTWTEPEVPVPDTFVVTEMPDLAFSSNLLHLICVVQYMYQRPQVLHFSSQNGGRSWSNPHQLFANTSAFLKYSRITCSGDTIFATCTTSDGILVIISYNNGENWGNPLHADYSYSVSNPPNIMYSGGRINLVYQFGNLEDTTGIEIYNRYSDDLGLTWSDRYGLSTLEHWHERKDSQAPSAYADSSGHIITLWFDYKYGSACGVSGDILGRISLDNGSTWLPETRLTCTQTGGYSSCLILNNKLYAAWADYYYFYCSKTKIMYSESSDWGTTWNDAGIISGFAERDERKPYIISGYSSEDTILHCIMSGQLPDEPSYLYYFYNDNITEIESELFENIPVDYSLSAYPNPFNNATIISYSNLEGGEIEIYDICGRLLRTLNMGGGKEGEVTWEATDTSGEKVSSGIYFARAVTSQGIAAIKLIFLK